MHHSVESPSQSSLGLKDYWDILFKRLWLLVIVLIFFGILAIFYTFHQPKIYQAQTTLIIEPESHAVLREFDIGAQATNWFLQGALFETQIRVIQSRHVAERTVRDLGLAENLEFLGLNHIEDEEKLARALEQSDPVERLLQALSVEPVKDTRMLVIKVQHQNPELAAMLANGVAKAYQEQHLDYRLANMQNAFRWLEDQYQAYEKKLEQSRAQLHDFIKQQGPLLFTNPSDQQEILNTELSQLHEKLLNLRDERRKVGYIFHQIQKFKGDYLNAGSLASLINSPTLSKFANTYLDLKRQEVSLLKDYLDGHPKVKNIRKQMTLLEQAIDSEIQGSLQLYRNHYRDLLKDEKALLQRIQSLESSAIQLEKLKLLYEQLENDKAEQQRLFELVQRHMNDVNLSQLLENNNVRILDRAQTPKHPIKPRPILNFAIFLAIGSMTALGLAFLLEWLDHNVHTQEDVERYLPFLGILPVIYKHDRVGQSALIQKGVSYVRDMHVLFYPRSSAAESMRVIRTNLFFMSPEKNLQIIVITSPSPLEGKTTTAISLALIMAQSDHPVLLIDLDMRRPRVHKGLQLEVDRGLADVLLGDAELDEVIVNTLEPHLEFLPCGTIPLNPSELLHTQKFKEILEKLRERYTRIIIDSPPVIVVTDALIISQYVDGVIIVCRSEQTHRALLARATEAMQSVNAPVLGAILNHVDLRSRRQSAYYYHYRYYGHYYRQQDESEHI